MIKMLALPRDMMPLLTTEAIPAHLLLLISSAAKENILLTWEQIFAAEAFVLDHPEVKKNKHRAFGAVVWISQRPAGYFTFVTSDKLRADNFPLNVDLIH